MTGDEEPEWRTNRERVAYEEGRRVLEAQKSDINDLDDKALRTVRITALLLGVGAAGARALSPRAIHSGVGLLSLGSFSLSLVFGVRVYSQSTEVIGPSADYLGRLRRDSVSADWEQDLLVQFHGWIDENQTIVERNAYLLNVCQLFFVVGVVSGGASLLAVDFGGTLIATLSVALVAIVVDTAVESLVDGRSK